ELGIKTLDIAKRLLDHRVHPPTVYFPLLVDEALMIEPTETETKERLDGFADAIREILAEAKEDPEIARNAPYSTPVRRLDEARAAKKPVVRQATGHGGRGSDRQVVPRRLAGGTIPDRCCPATPSWDRSGLSRSARQPNDPN